MERLFFFPILFLILIFEGIALKLLPEVIINTNLLIVPHWVFVFLVLIALFYDQTETYYAVLYASLFGFLIDIVYTDMLGVYLFTYPVAIYVVHLLKRVFHTNIYSTILMACIGLIITETIIYLIYLTVDITDMTLVNSLFNRLIPTLIANTIMLVLLYPIFKNMLIRWSMQLKS